MGEQQGVVLLLVRANQCAPALQVEHSVQPHLVFDVRRLPADPLPSELKGALKLPGVAANGGDRLPPLNCVRAFLSHRPSQALLALLAPNLLRYPQVKLNGTANPNSGSEPPPCS